MTPTHPPSPSGAPDGTAPAATPAASTSATHAPAGNRPGRVEAHGIDHIPDAERHGRPRDLFAVWAAANVNYLSLVVGGVLVLLGLSLWQAFLVCVVGNLFWILVGILAVSGPASGTPSEVVLRAVFGVRGNRVNIAVTGWGLCICYIALNLSAGAVAAFSLVERMGIEADTAVKAAVIVAISAVTLVIGVYGHATIVRLYAPITLLLTLAFAVVGYNVVRRADWDHAPAEPLEGAALWAVLLIGVTLIASGPLSYTNSADFSRYLPRSTSAAAVAGWTALGGFLPGVVVTFLGALAATAVDMGDPQASLESILPGWFTPLFPLAIVLSTIAINAMSAYSSGLALQAMGVRIRRSFSVVVDGLLAVFLTLYALLVSNFLDAVSTMLQLTVVLIGPGTAVYAADVLLRHNRYDGPGLTDPTPAGPYWYSAGVHWVGFAALGLGAATALLCVDSEPYTGPVARALGLDLSLPVGMTVAAAVYTVLFRRRGSAA
ncbi:purine-cytosine permease family protein [Nocardiopsis aegyptia]|uniref:Purine-cytosine permease-like protein n=1 Tax=Nocardiopsis aegyptia TaxID=220378 RepID=A0A7Z0EK02_9ACTN|nr:cytosine permease [Nocardiopsis aegyptia]NYJ33503.1 purine-cytosine permease-like protein [Nocardiopsis aegyptia]